MGRERGKTKERRREGERGSKGKRVKGLVHEHECKGHEGKEQRNGGT